MSTLIERIKSEPAVVVGTIVAALALVGIALDPAYVEALVVVLPLIGALVTRSKVTPVGPLAPGEVKLPDHGVNRELIDPGEIR